MDVDVHHLLLNSFLTTSFSGLNLPPLQSSNLPIIQLDNIFTIPSLFSSQPTPYASLQNLQEEILLFVQCQWLTPLQRAGSRELGAWSIVLFFSLSSLLLAPCSMLSGIFILDKKYSVFPNVKNKDLSLS